MDCVDAFVLLFRVPIVCDCLIVYGLLCGCSVLCCLCRVRLTYVVWCPALLFVVVLRDCVMCVVVNCTSMCLVVVCVLFGGLFAFLFACVSCA